METDQTDEELMLAYAQGDSHAFETLYTRHRGALYRFVQKQISRNDLADELFQDVWMRVIQARERYQVTAKFRTWLFQIAQNRVIDEVRKFRPEVSSQDSEDESIFDRISAENDESPEQSLSRFEQARRLQRALDELPNDQRESFLLRAEGELSLEEIGVVTGVGRETVKSRLRYSFAKLRERLS